MVRLAIFVMFSLRVVFSFPFYVFFFSSRRRHTRSLCDWSSDVCSSDLGIDTERFAAARADREKLIPGTSANDKLIIMTANMHTGAKGHGDLIEAARTVRDRKSTRLNSSHTVISYAVFCLKKKKTNRPDM